ncbi:MAG TPA: energy transducer TonB [Gammaproteobacteria bacterium]|nr:energy transducer TonB [Gammaproteobacteria bacterium]
MNSIVRWLVGIIIAAFVTFALFVMMKILITGDFKPQEKGAKTSFEINPKVEDIKIAVRETVIAKVRKVVTPPPPPQIERQQASQPSVAIASLEGAIPDFEAPVLDKQSFKITVSDRDAQPLVRIPPIMPPRADKSGHCDVRFDVSPEGAPFNVTAPYCTQSLFKRASVKSVQKWKYNPKIVDGRAVSRSGVESRIVFRLADERGNIIPE